MDYDLTSCPSYILKEIFVKLLESRDVSLKALSQLLNPKINTTQCKTIHELVKRYEEQHGKMSMEMWGNIFENLGYLKEFHDVIEQFNRQRSHANNDVTNSHNELQLVAMSAEFSSQLPVINGLDTDCDNLTMTVEVTVAPIQPPCTAWPSWSLPPPEKTDENKEASTNHARQLQAEADESGFFSGQSNDETSAVASNQQSPSLTLTSSQHVGEKEQNEMSKKEVKHTDATASSAECTQVNEVQPAVPASMSVDSTVRPSTPEASGSSCNASVSSLVTGHHPPCRSLRVGGSQDGLDGDQQTTGNPAENYDYTENYGLLEEQQKEIEQLQLTVSFLAQELRKKTSICTTLWDRHCHLTWELLDCRTQCANLHEQNDELTQHLNDITVLEAENQQMIRRQQEMLEWKEEECNRLEEHIRESEERYASALSDMAALNRERHEFAEILASLRVQLEEIQQERELFRIQESERLRAEHERLLEIRQGEVCRAFNNAETDKVKREKWKRKKAEEKKDKENQELRMLVRQLRSQKERNTTSDDIVDWENGDSGEDEYSSTSSSELETVNPASAIDQSASDESGDEELFEDASEELSDAP